MKNKTLLLITLPILTITSLVGCQTNKQSSDIPSINNSESSNELPLTSVVSSSSEDSIVSSSNSISESNSSISRITPGSMYTITYKDSAKQFLYGDNPTSAKPGSIVEIKTNIVYDADLVLHAYLEDGLDYFNETLSYTPMDDYWLFTFMMPGCPVTIDCEVITGPQISYADWPTTQIQSLADSLIGETSEIIPSYDYAFEIEVDTDSFVTEQYFGIYCYVYNAEFSETQYIDRLNECGWDVSDTKIEGFYEAYSPNDKIWLNFKYDPFYEDLEIYVTEAPITSWPTDLIAENIQYIAEDTETVIPSFEAELYVVNYYPTFATLAINGYGVDEKIVSLYKDKVEQLNWVTSETDNEGEYEAVSPLEDIKITFYYEASKDEFNIDVQKKAEETSSWPKESLAGLLAKLGYTGEIMKYLGEFESVEVDDNIYYPTVIVYVEKGTEQAAAAAYNQMLLNNGYIKAGTMYGEDFYYYPGTTVAYHATCLGGDCFTIEIMCIDDFAE